MPTVADKHAFAGAFADAAPLEAPAPELGDGVVVRFRRCTVDDLLAVAKVDFERPLVLDLILARLTLIDADGDQLVDPNDDVWFQRGTDGVLLARLAKRAGLAAEFALAFRPAVGEDSGEALTADRVRRTIADLAVAMRLSPDAIRRWPVADFVDVLRSARGADAEDAEDADAEDAEDADAEDG